MQNASYAKFLTNVEINDDLDLSFFIRTRGSEALVTVLTDTTLRSTLAVALDNGDIVVEVNNYGSKSKISLDYKVNDGAWHFVLLNGSVSRVDNKTFQGVTVSRSITLQHTYIGGLEDYSAFPDGALPNKTPFRGCVQDMRLNKKLFQFHTPDASQDSYKLIAAEHLDTGCPGQDVCSANPCGGGGVCRDVWDEHQCDCHPRYGGPDCSLYGCALVNLCPDNSTCVDVGERYECK